MTTFAKIISTTPVSKQLQRVALETSQPISIIQDLHSVVANTLPDGVIPMERTFLPSDKSKNITIGIVKSMPESITLDEASQRGFVTASTNVLIDSTTNEQWNVVYDEESGESCVIKEEGTDLTKLLSQLQSASPYSNLTNEVQTAFGEDFFRKSQVPTGFLFNHFVTPEGTRNGAVAMYDQVGSFCIDSEGNTHSVSHEANVGLVTVTLDKILQSNAKFKGSTIEAQKAEFDSNFGVPPENTDDAVEFYKALYAWAPEVQDMIDQLISQSIVL